MRVAVVLPARLAATRFPGKLLAELHGRPVWWWAWRAASQARGIDRVVLAVDGPELAASGRRWGAEVVMTSPEHGTGTERVAEVARSLEVEAVLDVQADEPHLAPSLVEALAERLRGGAAMVTAAAPLAEGDGERDQVVKVVLSQGRAVDFQRRHPVGVTGVARHVGVYGWQVSVLLDLVGRPAVPEETALRLEQWRALRAGVPIDVVWTTAPGRGVDLPEDLDHLRGLPPPQPAPAVPMGVPLAR